MNNNQDRHDHRISLGLGAALERWGYLSHRYKSGVATEFENAERLLLAEALNDIKVTVNASCVPGEDLNRDGIPDTVEFFTLMAKTDCCVLRTHDPEVRVAPASKGRKGRL